ncbi:MAG: nitroreductase family protein [Candidatus Methanofastidiosia archaeon]
MKEFLSLIEKRRSIRKFKDEKIPREVVFEILRLGQRAPTACSFQTYSFILIEDERREIFRLSNYQEMVLEAPVLILVCADLKRFKRVLKFAGACRKLGTSTRIFSIIDATLAAQNMVLACEAFGLSSVFVGSVLDNAKEISKVLNLPEEVLPLYLLCIGCADENPPPRPRWRLESILHKDRYREIKDEEIERFLEEMNRDLKREEYYLKYTGRDIHYKEHLLRKTENEERNELIEKFIGG